MARSKALLPLMVMLLGGCTVGPDYRAPDVAVPTAYSMTVAAAPTPEQWWKAFDDPVLDGLIDRALAGNLDLQQAAVRIREARQSEAATRFAGGPTLNASGQASDTRLSENSLPAALTSLGSGGGAGSGQGGGLGLPGESFPTYQLGFDASWELDLFGGQRRANQAAGARTQGAVWSARDAQVVLTAEVANTYQQYRGLQRRLIATDAGPLHAEGPAGTSSPRAPPTASPPPWTAVASSRRSSS